MTTIVVPLDGSDFAERALRPACAFSARMKGARVLLLHCAADVSTAVRTRLDDRASSFAPAVDVEARIVGAERAADGILGVVGSIPDAVLCMSTQGRGGLRTAVVGSVAAEVVRRSTVPLVLIGPGFQTTLLPGERARLLVCSDGSPFADAIIPVAASWVSELQLEPWLVEVVGPDEDVAFPGQTRRNEQVEAASARLDVLSDRLETPARPAHRQVLHGTPPSRSIVAFASRLPAVLIAMATHGRAGLARTTAGSVTTDVVRHAPCPVLVTRPASDLRPAP